MAAPVITLNRQKQTLVAEAGPANPVRTVLLNNAPARPAANQPESASNPRKISGGKPANPSVVRLRSGDLHYSEGERVAFFHSGLAGSVTAESTGPDGVSTVVSQEAEVHLLPAGVHGGAPGASARSTAQASPNAAGTPVNSLGNTSPGNASIDRLTALGHVTVDWPDRRGTGEKLVYLSDDGTFTLTGTSGAPPRITDTERGAVTGNALIFHSRDDSVTVEGDGGKTITDTYAVKSRKPPA